MNDNVEITATFNSPNKGFSLSFIKDNNDFLKSRYSIGVDAYQHLLALYTLADGTEVGLTSSQIQYTLNSDLALSIRIENQAVTLKLNNVTISTIYVPDLRYVGITNWNNAKTVTVKNLKVKPL